MIKNIFQKFKHKLYHRKNTKNHEQNLREYESLMKNKLGYEIHEFEVYGECGVNFSFYTKKLEVEYIIWETETFNVKNDYKQYGQIHKFISKDMSVIGNKNIPNYGSHMYEILNKIKNKKIQTFENKEDLIKSLKEFSFNDFEMKKFPYFHDAISLMSNYIQFLK